jgi:PPOX class probable F420-dependent enzyme
MSEDKLLNLFGDTGWGTLATLKRDGRPQLSIVSYAFDRDTRLVRASVTDDRAKTRNIRRDPRVSFQVTASDGSAYAVAEGTAELTPVAAEPDDATVEELIEVYRAILGEHPDWADYRATMVADRRLVFRLSIDRVYGWAGPDA